MGVRMAFAGSGMSSALLACGWALAWPAAAQQKACGQGQFDYRLPEAPAAAATNCVACPPGTYRGEPAHFERSCITQAVTPCKRGERAPYAR